MLRYYCCFCDYIYDPEAGDPERDIAAGTAFKDLPANWKCPTCDEGKSEFDSMDD